MSRKRNFVRTVYWQGKPSRNKYEKPHQGLHECARRLLRMNPSLEMADTDEMKKHSPGVDSFLTQWGSIGYHELRWLIRGIPHGEVEQRDPTPS
jgi:hypothetical protein